jgi:hypothetical protein
LLLGPLSPGPVLEIDDRELEIDQNVEQQHQEYDHFNEKKPNMDPTGEWDSDRPEGEEKGEDNSN